MSDAKINIEIGSDGATSGARAVNTAVQQVKNGFIELSAKLFVVQQALVQVWASARRGAEFEETIGRLNRQTAQFNTTTSALVNTFQRATASQVSLERSTQLMSRALAVGLDPGQIEVFAQAADALGDVLGTDIPTAFDQIVQSAITGRSQILGNIGVFVDLDEEMKKLAVSTGRTVDQITKQEKAMLAAKAITEQADGALRRLSDGALSDADKLNQITAKWDNFWLSIGQKSKSAVVTAVESLSALADAVEKNNPFRKAEEIVQKFTPGSPTNPATQEIFGRAIVQNALGNLDRPTTARTEPVKELSSSLRGSQLLADRERLSTGVRNELDRDRQVYASILQMDSVMARARIATFEEVENSRIQVRALELEAERRSIQEQLKIEEETHKQRVRIGFETTEERIAEDERYISKKFDLNERAKENELKIAQDSLLGEAETALLRGQLQEQLGDRIAKALKSEYDVRESMRQQDLESAEAYYKGQIDMAQATFATDQQIANSEREVLRDRMAFRLRITKEAAAQLLEMRRTNNVEGVNTALAQADPTLSLRARQGITDTFTAQDIELRERANGEFFAGWARGLQGYMRNTQTAFGFAQDMARRTAQTMEGGFQQLFFDPFKDGWKGMLNDLLTMTRQILAQMAAQMVTSGVMNFLMQFVGSAGQSGLLGIGGRNVSGVNVAALTFAGGGVGDFGIGTPAMLHNREAVVPLPDGRSIPVSFASNSEPAKPLSVTIINQHAGANVEAEQRRNSRTGDMELEILVTKAVNKSIQQGQMDKTMRSRFGLTPGER